MIKVMNHLDNIQKFLEYRVMTSKEQLNWLIPKLMEAGTSFAMIDGILYMSKGSYEVLCAGPNKENND